MNTTKIEIATINDVEKLIPVFSELRPHRTVAELYELFKEAFKEGYQVAYIGNEQMAYSILGFRMVTFIFSGKTLKVDDLATLSSQRGKGYADHLFAWIKEYARLNSCEHICLDSGFQRRDAHRFYLNHGLLIESLHFGRKVGEL